MNQQMDYIQKLLQVLPDSPLQRLLTPDSFSRLVQWKSLRRREEESIAYLLVREENVFTQLQKALTRARLDRCVAAPASQGSPHAASTPSQFGAGSPHQQGTGWQCWKPTTGDSSYSSSGSDVNSTHSGWSFCDK